MERSTCRWGILGTAGIARKNWHAIQLSPHASLTAVASRSLDTSQAFINECQRDVPHKTVPEAVEGYAALLERDDVDAVYIPLPTGLRKEWVIRAAEHGKHVIGEKPSAVSVDDLQEMLAACRENNVQYMDGVMFMHSDRLSEMGRRLNDGTSVGQLRRIASHHTFAADDAFLKENIRLNAALEPQGALGDLGWYSIRFILWAMNWQLPNEVRGLTLNETHRDDSPGPVPLEFSGEFQFDGVSASFYCSFVTENQQWVNIGGTKGFMHVADFVLPFYGSELCFDVAQANFAVEGCQFNMERHTQTIATNEYANNAANSQETKMISAFSQQVCSGALNTSWEQMALKTQQVMDACLASARQGGAVVSMNG